MTSGHTCVVPGCERWLPHKMLMCAAHWRAVPAPLQFAVAMAYHPVDEVGHAEQTPEYREAVVAAIASVQEVSP